GGGLPGEGGQENGAVWAAGDAAILMTRAEFLHRRLLGGAGGGPGAAVPSGVEVLRVQLADPGPVGQAPATARKDLLRLLDDLRPSYRDLPRVGPADGEPSGRWPRDGCAVTGRLSGVGPLYPTLPGSARVHVGFVVPVCEFGGA